MTAHCRTCRYWQPDILSVDENAPDAEPMFGECVLISRRLNERNATIQSRVFLPPGKMLDSVNLAIESETYLQTDAHFGCVDHRPTKGNET